MFQLQWSLCQYLKFIIGSLSFFSDSTQYWNMENWQWSDWVIRAGKIKLKSSPSSSISNWQNAEAFKGASRCDEKSNCKSRNPSPYLTAKGSVFWFSWLFGTIFWPYKVLTLTLLRHFPHGNVCWIHLRISRLGTGTNN